MTNNERSQGIRQEHGNACGDNCAVTIKQNRMPRCSLPSEEQRLEQNIDVGGVEKDKDKENRNENTTTLSLWREKNSYRSIPPHPWNAAVRFLLVCVFFFLPKPTTGQNLVGVYKSKEEPKPRTIVTFDSLVRLEVSPNFYNSSVDEQNKFMDMLLISYNDGNQFNQGICDPLERVVVSCSMRSIDHCEGQTRASLLVEFQGICDSCPEDTNLFHNSQQKIPTNGRKHLRGLFQRRDSACFVGAPTTTE